MADENTFIPFLIVGVVIVAIGILLVFSMSPTITRWTWMVLQLISMLAANMQGAISEAM